MNQPKRILFFLFVLSGFCGILYQVVWLRLAFAAFGIVTPVLSVVLSVFMVGLALGSVAGGRIAQRLAQSSLSPLWFYVGIEAVIGLSAFAVPYLFRSGGATLLTFGEMDSGKYLLTSAALISISILPWCLCMGATFPAVMAYLKKQYPNDTTGFSYLYLGNVIGAMAGALVTAAVLVEIYGFAGTLLVGAALNAFIALVAAGLASSDTANPLPAVAKKRPARSVSNRITLAILFATGFTSMGMEVVWTRAFTPALRTTIYAFAMLLAIYLLATWLGSWAYRRHCTQGKVRSREHLLHWLAFAACLPIALNDPRLYLRGVGAAISIFPFCYLLGYLTPLLIDENSEGDADTAGYAYAVNILGCVLGPLVAGYLLLPWLGVKWSLLALAMPFLCTLFTAFSWKRSRQALTYATIAAFVLSAGPARSYEEQAEASNGVVRRDHTATVIASQEPNGIKHMYVNGISITILTPLTKMMAHLPLASLDTTPGKALVICFGMGTTFRSLHSWGLDAWAAELVPSVRDSFGFYFPEGPELLKDPKSHVVIDDGRRFLRRTSEKFDVITLDPPPPIEAAGSSLLYSLEFYRDAKARLAPGGILQQWFPGGDQSILQAIATSLHRSFPYVRAFQSPESTGVFFLASDSPIARRSAAELAQRLPDRAKADLIEWNQGQTPEQAFERVLAQERPLESIMGRPEWFISDDRPLNEYYLMRRTLGWK